MRISDWSSDVALPIYSNGHKCLPVRSGYRDARGHWASCLLSWRNQSPIDRGEDFRRSNDRSIRFDPLRIAIDQLIDMRAEQDSETHQFLHQIGRAHVCTPVPNAQLVCRLLIEKK